MTRARLLGGLLASALFAIVTSVYHLEFSLWLVKSRPFGLKPVEYLPYVWGVLGVAVIAFVAWSAWRSANRLPTLAYWGAWLALAVIADRWLLFSAAEYIHYPQYAVLAWLLAWTLDPKRDGHAFGTVLLLAVVIGIADEVHQYFLETISYSDYLDFNDFLLNLLGAAAGLLLYYGFRPLSAAGGRAVSLGFVFLGLAMLAALGVLEVLGGQEHIEREAGSYGSWKGSVLRDRYYVLDPWTGTLALALIGTFFAGYPRPWVRRAPGQVPAEEPR